MAGIQVWLWAGLCGWRGQQGSGERWRLNSFTAWLNMRYKSRGVECDLHSPPWLGGGTSDALRNLVNRGVGERGGLLSFAKYTLLSQESTALPPGPRGQALLVPATGQGV